MSSLVILKGVDERIERVGVGEETGKREVGGKGWQVMWVGIRLTNSPHLVRPQAVDFGTR